MIYSDVLLKKKFLSFAAGEFAALLFCGEWIWLEKWVKSVAYWFYFIGFLIWFYFDFANVISPNSCIRAPIDILGLDWNFEIICLDWLG